MLRSVPDARLRRLVGALGPDDGARAYLEGLRWPGGVACPRCDSGRAGWLEERAKHYCRDCGYQFRVTAGTAFHDSHVSLTRWLVAIHLIVDSEQGFPAHKLWRTLGGSYKTAWFLGHRIRSAMSQSLHDVGLPSGRRLVGGAYRRTGAGHLAAYRNEARWRAAHLDNEHVFRETVVALLEAHPIQYHRLIDHAQPGYAAAGLR